MGFYTPEIQNVQSDDVAVYGELAGLHVKMKLSDYEIDTILDYDQVANLKTQFQNWLDYVDNRGGTDFIEKSKVKINGKNDIPF